MLLAQAVLLSLTHTLLLQFALREEEEEAEEEEEQQQESKDSRCDVHETSRQMM